MGYACVFSWFNMDMQLNFLAFSGGPLTITDANLVLGRLLPEFFPCIFGENENEPLDYEASWKAFTALTDEVCSQGSLKLV